MATLSPYQSQNGSSFNPAKIGDPKALETGWSLIRSTDLLGGFKLYDSGPNRYEYRPSRLILIFYLLFVAFGLGAVGIGIHYYLLTNTLEVISLVPVIIGAGFVLMGGYSFQRGTRPVVFDKSIGAYWRGRTTPVMYAPNPGLKEYCKLDDIRALQLIGELVRMKNQNIYVYELNLVLKDSNRLNVITHYKPEQLRQDANTLSGFLGKPVWSGI